MDDALERSFQVAREMSRKADDLIRELVSKPDGTVLAIEDSIESSRTEDETGAYTLHISQRYAFTVADEDGQVRHVPAGWRFVGPIDDTLRARIAEMDATTD